MNDYAEQYGKDIRIEKGTFVKLGHCSNCNRESGFCPIVYEVSIKGFSFRMCKECLTILKELITRWKI